MARKKGPPTRGTALSYAVRAPIRLHTYGDVLDYIDQLTPAQQKKPHWVEIRALLTTERLWTKAWLTRLVENAANKEAE
jgi:hypothetical protein